MFPKLKAAFAPGIVRLVLALVVALHHISNIAIGTWAVDVFFVLSGYWVTVMFRKRYQRYERPTLTFYVSRVLRLLPVLVFCQLLVIGVLYSLHSPELTAVTPWWTLRALLMVGSARQHVLLVPSWSLDVEAQFYLVTPLLVLLLDRFSASTARSVALLLCLASMPFAFDRTAIIDSPWLYTFGCFFLIGVAQAYRPWLPSGRTALLSLGATIAAVLGSIALPFSRGLVLGGSHPWNPALFTHNGTFCMFLAFVTVPFIFYSLAIRSSPRDRELGNMAYPLYLFHWVVLDLLLGGVLSHNKNLARLEFLVIAALGAVAIELWVDHPLERLRESLLRRLFKEQQNPIKVA